MSAVDVVMVTLRQSAVTQKGAGRQSQSSASFVFRPPSSVSNSVPANTNARKGGFGMKAVQMIGAGENPLELHEIPVPADWRARILVRVRAAGICHSDAH